MSTPNTHTMVRNILAVWAEATPAQIEAGAQWYSEARELAVLLSAQSGHDIDTVAAVIAHLSPRTPWASNVAAATSLLTTGEAPGQLRMNVERARAAIASDNPLATINGPKTQAFAANIIGDDQAVTVDVWAARVAGVHRDKLAKRKVKGGVTTYPVYESVAEAYRIAAAEAGVSPATMQATTWILARNGRAS